MSADLERYLKRAASSMDDAATELKRGNVERAGSALAEAAYAIRRASRAAS